MSLTGYKVGAVDLFAFHTSNPASNTGYNVGIKDIFTYYADLSGNYQTNLSKFNFIYKNNNFNNNVDIILYNYFSTATIGTPANAIFGNINNRLCWEITNTTTFTPKFSYKTTINFLAVGGGQSGNSFYTAGGYGGGVVYGTIYLLNNNTLTISIGNSDNPTTITGGNINITANAGSSNNPSGLASGTDVISSNMVPSAAGGFTPIRNGSDGYYSSQLSLYVGGGGGLSFNIGYPGGLGGGGAGGSGNIHGYNGISNTGGGGGGSDSSFPGLGGSGVVYFYL